jgi:hypothetical protein
MGVPLLYNRRFAGARRSGGAQVAQLVEHATENRSVGGSIPPLGTSKIKYLRMATDCVLTVLGSDVDNLERYLFPVKSILRTALRACRDVSAVSE